jgi:hypothetical protein
LNYLTSAEWEALERKRRLAKRIISDFEGGSTKIALRDMLTRGGEMLFEALCDPAKHIAKMSAASAAAKGVGQSAKERAVAEAKVAKMRAHAKRQRQIGHAIRDFVNSHKYKLEGDGLDDGADGGTKEVQSQLELEAWMAKVSFGLFFGVFCVLHFCVFICKYKSSHTFVSFHSQRFSHMMMFLSNYTVEWHPAKERRRFRRCARDCEALWGRYEGHENRSDDAAAETTAAQSRCIHLHYAQQRVDCDLHSK